MKIAFSFSFFLFIFLNSNAQQTIKGVILSSNKTPLEGASVFFNNTTIGTISDKKGCFELHFPKGSYNLVISYLGYKKVIKPINTITNSPLTIILEEDNNLLNEVIIKKTIYDEDWHYNFARFKNAFLGRSKLAKECKILNPKKLHFEFNSLSNTLTAIAREPLLIKNKALGYLITYDLVDFSLNRENLVFSGYAKYDNLRKSVRKKHASNRLKAFNGSRMHFLRSLLSKELKKEGFVVNQFKRVKNQECPSEEKIKEARKFLKSYNGKINFSKKITFPKTSLDSVLITLRKSKLPKFRDYLYKRNVPYKEMISHQKDVSFLDFKNFLSITYTKETEEENYLKSLFGKRKKASGVQSSSIVLLEGKVTIFKKGILENPTSVFNEGYWGFEALANMLPLNYTPKN